MPLDSSRVPDLWCSGACLNYVMGHFNDDRDGVDLRDRARGRGWVCDETGDWCPRCQEARR